MISEKLREAKVFYRVYDRFKHFDSLSKEKLDELEKEFWIEKAKYDRSGRLRAYLKLTDLQVPMGGLQNGLG